MRDWVTNLATTHYLVGSAIGPHPFPTIVRDFQRVIGREIKSQMAEVRGKLPDVVVACVGGGSNAIGAFYDFIPDKNVRLVGVEAGGEGRLQEGLSSFHTLSGRLQVSIHLSTALHWLWERLVCSMVFGRTSCSRPRDKLSKHIPLVLVWIIPVLGPNMLG